MTFRLGSCVECGMRSPTVASCAALKLHSDVEEKETGTAKG
jgi:hypothetical protein